MLGVWMRLRQQRRIRLKLDDSTGLDSVFKRILVAVDGSQSSLRAARLAVRLAERDGSELTVVSAVPRPNYALAAIPTSGGGGMPTLGLPDYYRSASEEAEEWVDKAASIAESRQVKVRKRVLKGGASIVKSVTDYAAAQNVDLIVVGTKGSGGFRRLLLGSVSNGVVNHAASSVLVVR
jgi:nucleotide-binding universal stress UspA family protein